MKYIIGVDVGGTKIDCVIANTEGDILSEVTISGGNPLSIGIEKSSKNIISSIIECNKEIQINYEDISLALIGSTGVGRNKDADKLLNELKNISNIKNIKVTTDAHIALEGTFPNKPGCILIAGTGSIIYGKDEEGIIHRAGGFGSIIGDQGGGFSIGRNGLIAVSKEFDGRGKKTLITDLLADKFNIKNSDDLISKVYRNKLAPSEVAPIILEAAELKDEIAINILNNGTNELIELIHAIKIKLNLDKFKLAFAGSLISNKNYYSDLVRKKINEECKFVEVTDAENIPAVGAILLAKKYLAVNK